MSETPDTTPEQAPTETPAVSLPEAPAAAAHTPGFSAALGDSRGVAPEVAEEREEARRKASAIEKAQRLDELVDRLDAEDPADAIKTSELVTEYVQKWNLSARQVRRYITDAWAQVDKERAQQRGSRRALHIARYEAAFQRLWDEGKYSEATKVLQLAERLQGMEPAQKVHITDDRAKAPSDMSESELDAALKAKGLL